MKNTLLLLSLFLFFASQNVFAQEIYFEFINSSFDDIPQANYTPSSWWDCGFADETPPDVHPNSFSHLTQSPNNGTSYVGMVVRENNTWEALTQRLEYSLFPHRCYSFNIFLCKSEEYLSDINGEQDKIDFNAPIILRVWGGTGYCNKMELLDESELVDHTDWKKYQFQFSPNKRVNYIVLESYYKEELHSKIPNGNILLDNLSPIYLEKCPTLSSIDTLVEYIKMNANQIPFFKQNNELTESAKKFLLKIKKEVSTIENTNFTFSVRKQIESLGKTNQLDSFFRENTFNEKNFSVEEYLYLNRKIEWIYQGSEISIGFQFLNK